MDECQQGLALARERGDRALERDLLSQIVAPLVFLGRWDEAASHATPQLDGEEDINAVCGAAFMAAVAGARGDEPMLERCLGVAQASRASTYVDARMAANLVFGYVTAERRAFAEALGLARELLAMHGTGQELIDAAYEIGRRSGPALDDRDAMAELDAHVSALPPARATPLLRAERARLAAEQAHRRGEDGVAQDLENQALALARSVGARPLEARGLLDKVRRREDGDALSEARAIYEALGASSWLSRIEIDAQLVS